MRERRQDARGSKGFALGLGARQHAALQIGNGREDRAKFSREDGRDASGAEKGAACVVEVAVHGQELRPP